LPRSLRINNFHSRSPATNRATAKSPPAEAAGPQAWHRRGGDPPPAERNHCARQQQSLSHSPPRRARPVSGKAYGPVLLPAYTPALPLMVAALSWGAGPGSWIATLNYIGYFIGSLVVARGWVEPNRAVYRLSLIVSTLGLTAVALTPNLIWQGSIRTVAGIASGLIFVCVTQRIPANARGRHDGGIVFGGVGFGILVSGAIVLTAGSFADWRQLWLICAAVSAVFTVIAWTWPIPVR